MADVTMINISGGKVLAANVEGNVYFVQKPERVLRRYVERPPADVYVARPAELQLLAEGLESDSCVAATSAQAVGEGGYGKTWLARAYAYAFEARYPGGMFEIRIGNSSSLVDLLADLYGPDEALTREERADAAFQYLSGDSRCLLILDNVEDRTQWKSIRESGLLPTAYCHLLVTTRAFDLPDLRQVHVGRLHKKEAAALLAKYDAKSQHPLELLKNHRELVDKIIKESEGMAVLIAAIGAGLINTSLDDLTAYVDWLVNLVPEQDTDGTWANYPQKSGAIFSSLYERLHKASVRALEFAALFPPDLINPDDLRAVLVADQSDPALVWEPQLTGRPKPADSYLAPLRDREILTGLETGPWSLHRLHRRALAARLSDRELAARLERLEARASERFQIADDEADQSLYLSAVRNISYTIALMQGIRVVVAPRGEWSTALQNNLANAHVIRGVAYQNAQDLAAAIEDYDVAITIMTGIRDALAPRGEWAPEFQNDLARAHMNRGAAYDSDQKLAAAIEDYDVAITIRTGIREALEPRGEWELDLQDDLAKAHVNRGIAYQKIAQDLRAAIEDYGVAITIRTGIREVLEPRGEWAPAHQNDLAKAHVNRGNAYLNAQDLAAAIEDYGVVITIRTGIREALAPRGEWSPTLQNDLANAHVNRGNAYQFAQDLAAAFEDYGVAITIRNGIREDLAPRGEWAPAFQNDLAKVYEFRGMAYQIAQDVLAAIDDYDAALIVQSQLVEVHAEFAVDLQRLIATWSLLGVGLIPDDIRLARTNLRRLQTRFDAPTLARLEIPKFNRQIADGLPNVTPALSATEFAAARAALLGSE